MYQKIMLGLGLLSCLLAIGCAGGHFHRRCTRPTIAHQVPVGTAVAPAPCCNGTALPPGAAPGVQQQVPAFSPPHGAQPVAPGQQLIVPNKHHRGVVVPPGH